MLIFAVALYFVVVFWLGGVWEGGVLVSVTQFHLCRCLLSFWCLYLASVATLLERHWGGAPAVRSAQLFVAFRRLLVLYKVPPAALCKVPDDHKPICMLMDFRFTDRCSGVEFSR